MRRFKESLARFFYGRNGADALYQATMWVCLGLMVIQMLVGSWVLFAVEIVLLVWASFRFFSRNLSKRQRENRAFLTFWGRIRGWFRLKRNAFRDRKTHVYRRCPQCKNTLRLPREKGKHTVCCPCCRHRFSMKV